MSVEYAENAPEEINYPSEGIILRSIEWHIPFLQFFFKNKPNHSEIIGNNLNERQIIVSVKLSFLPSALIIILLVEFTPILNVNQFTISGAHNEIGN